MSKQRNWENPAVTAEWETAKTTNPPTAVTARDEAVAAVLKRYPACDRTGVVLIVDAIPADIWQKLADERHMVGERT